ncbi:solute carrier family 12 member 2-like [Centruroides sculpturatus]|uniref:solute carrier family 12 member 2-like n=1 Tax=Centruroides sculpturatus TaxID=218467 RepID=UPI000C6D0B12|nr:solute carrier family 12 member 2-like [Centruroides sculpturatus]
MEEKSLVDKRVSPKIASRNGEWIEMDGKGSKSDPKQSRFQVAKVDFVNETTPLTHASRDDGDGEKTNGSENGRGQSPTHHSTYNTYDTHNIQSLRHYTREALPRLDHYRNIMSVHGHLNRPTLDELHNATLTMSQDNKRYSYKQVKSPDDDVIQKGAVKLGWIQGVLIRCLLNIWGVMLFLRLSWVVGQAGIGLGCLVILLASGVTILTTLSMSAICTNGEVKGGGTYYMISRSLGPEFGGAIGLIFSLANAIAIAMYVVGFAETLRDLLTAQVVLLIILLVSMFDFVIGSFIPPNTAQKAQGYVGWSLSLASENFKPHFRGETFFSVFSVYFPAATGILAGANISGDLANPQHSIPKGTFLAIFISTLSYILFAVIAGATVYRDANGVEFFAQNGTVELIRNCSLAESGYCKYGLMNNYQVMEQVSAFGPIIYAGIFAATLSSALASLVSAPKVFQALCKDNLFPHIHIFAKGYGKNAEPRRAYLLAFVIALACIAIGQLNEIAPIISNFFLAAYCLINFSCFHASFARSPGFRPAFKYYNLWLSLLGAILCLAVMFIMNWWTALITFAIILALYIYIYYRKPDVNWGSSTQAQTYKVALEAVIKLNQVQEHVKNYRPQILVLTGNPNSRPPLADFAYSICKKLGLVVCGHVVKGPMSQRYRVAQTKQAYNWFQKRKMKAFYSLIEEDVFSRGVRNLIQLVGVGKLRPNVVFMGYKSNWQECDPEETLEYFNTIHESFDMHMSLGILRLQEGLDYSQYTDLEEFAAPVVNGKGSKAGMEKEMANTGFPRNVSSAQLSQAMKPTSSWLTMFAAFTAGGLTMLVPYLLTTRSVWSGCKLRVFSLANKKDELDREQRNMAALLSKFRIDYSDVMVVPDVVKPPQESSKKEFEALISKWREKEESDEHNPAVITDAELIALKDKTNRHIRLREIVLKYSKDATLIVMTLPMPRKGTCSAPLYMAWLETLTKNMPPFLLIRGNQTSVLTFYS